jgi:hypothetical protein
MRSAASEERGIAVIVAMMALLLFSAIGAALVLGTSTETLIARNFGARAGAAYAADAIVQQAVYELGLVPDWTAIVSGVAQSTFADGPPGGNRTLPDGTAVNLTEVLNLANCQKFVTCSDSELARVTAERPWGSNNPRWRLYAYGRMPDGTAAAVNRAAFYVVALVADDPEEVDGNPSVDAAAPEPGAGNILLRGEAFGPAGAHAVVEATATRVDPSELSSIPGTPAVRVVTWRLNH